jgi:hypothetical protein
MKSIVCSVFVAMLCSTAPAFAAPCAPKSLVHIVVTDVDPSIPPTAFGAQPKSYYRLGSGKARTEEALDAANGIHELLVVNSPNVWMANLYDNTGTHIVDPNPPTITQMPVFSDFMASPKFSTLEFGARPATLQRTISFRFARSTLARTHSMYIASKRGPMPSKSWSDRQRACRPMRESIEAGNLCSSCDTTCMPSAFPTIPPCSHSLRA